MMQKMFVRASRDDDTRNAARIQIAPSRDESSSEDMKVDEAPTFASSAQSSECL